MILLMPSVDIDTGVNVKHSDDMRISELARLATTSTRSLRHYEKQGLLNPVRLENGYREYTTDAVRTVQCIRWLLAAGLTTYAIREVLPCVLAEKPKEIRCVALRHKLQSEMDRLAVQVKGLKQSISLLRKALGAGRQYVGR
jgi:DNA-binding transcriptional MerR regulator